MFAEREVKLFRDNRVRSQNGLANNKIFKEKAVLFQSCKNHQPLFVIEARDTVPLQNWEKDVIRANSEYILSISPRGTVKVSSDMELK